MNYLTQAKNFFLNFHKGKVIIVLHVIGFVLVFVSVYMLDYILFALSLIVLESGHVYNHIRKIKPYDFRPRTLFWRIVSFAALVLVFYFATLLIK